MSEQNRLIIFLLVFSFALNIGIIGYLIYERATHANQISPLPPPETKAPENIRNSFHHPRYSYKDIKLTAEERRELRAFFKNIFVTLRPLIVKQINLKRELFQSINSGDIAKTKALVKEIHENQAKIDIIFLEKATEEVKKFPKEKQRYITYRIMRFVSISKRRRF